MLITDGGLDMPPIFEIAVARFCATIVAFVMYRNGFFFFHIYILISKLLHSPLLKLFPSFSPPFSITVMLAATAAIKKHDAVTTS